jgi:hypothetical protein
MPRTKAKTATPMDKYLYVSVSSPPSSPDFAATNVIRIHQ